jgi:hypothetical protein
MNSYHLFSLERAGMVGAVSVVQGHDWYGEGAGLLASRQLLNGSWADRKTTAVIDTAFALLFLRKAALSSDVATGDRQRR